MLSLFLILQSHAAYFLLVPSTNSTFKVSVHIISFRIKYDKKCDEVISLWRETTRYSQDAAQERVDQEARYAKRSANNNSAKSKPAFTLATEVDGLYNKTGQQTNAWR